MPKLLDHYDVEMFKKNFSNNTTATTIILPNMNHNIAENTKK